MRRKLAFLAAMTGVAGLGVQAAPVGAAIPGPDAAQYILTAAAGSADAPDSRPPMPDGVFDDASGSPIHLNRFAGQVLVVNFWATWCAPCVQEMTSLDRLQGDMKGKPLQVLPISEDMGGIPVAKGFFDRQKITFLKPYADPKGAMALGLKVEGLPTSFVIDKHGRVASYLTGPTAWDNPQILARFYILTAEQ